MAVAGAMMHGLCRKSRDMVRVMDQRREREREAVHRRKEIDLIVPRYRVFNKNTKTRRKDASLDADSFLLVPLWMTSDNVPVVVAKEGFLRGGGRRPLALVSAVSIVFGIGFPSKYSISTDTFLEETIFKNPTLAIGTIFGI